METLLQRVRVNLKKRKTLKKKNKRKKKKLKNLQMSLFKIWRNFGRNKKKNSRENNKKIKTREVEEKL